MLEPRIHVTAFIQHACERPGVIDDAVATALDAPVTRWHQFPLELREGIDIFGMRKRAERQFEWLDMESLLWEMVKIGSAPFWNHLMMNAHSTHTENLVKALRSTPTGAPATMERNNRSFFGIAIPLVVMGALWGEDVKHFSGEMTTSTPAMEAVGGYFKTPAESGEVLVSRLHQLFPQAGADQEENSAYTFLIRNDAFRSLSARRSICPAIKPTQAIFEAFGRALAPSHKYGQSFLQTIGR